MLFLSILCVPQVTAFWGIRHMSSCDGICDALRSGGQPCHTPATRKPNGICDAAHRPLPTRKTMPKVTDHPGASIFQLADGRYVERWADPPQNKQKQESLDELPNKKARTKWAKDKAKGLQQTKLAIKHGRAIPDRKTLLQARDEFLSRAQITKATREVQTAPVNVIV